VLLECLHTHANGIPLMAQATPDTRKLFFLKTPLTYWLREEKTRNAEVDFLVSVGKQIVPIEVKSGATGTLRSLREFCQSKSPNLAVRLDANMPSITTLSGWSEPKANAINLVSLPLYMTSEIKRIVKSVSANSQRG